MALVCARSGFIAVVPGISLLDLAPDLIASDIADAVTQILAVTHEIGIAHDSATSRFECPVQGSSP